MCGSGSGRRLIQTPERKPALGYILAATAATLWALNASLAKPLLVDDHVSAFRLSQLRSTGTFLILLGALALLRRDLLRVRRSEIPALAFLGIAGLALVHALYFLAIAKLEVGVALAIQYTAPLLILLWLRVSHGRRFAPALWGAMALSMAGCFFVLRAYDVGALDAAGVAAAFGSAVTFAIYIVGSERAGHRHQPFTTLVWAFGFEALFWAVVTPWWDFPFGAFSSAGNIALGAGVIVVGTLVPFACMVVALRHVPATRAAIVATLEPVLAAVFAYATQGESLAAVQIAGGVAVVTGVAWVQTHQPDLAEEGAPPLRWPKGGAR